METSKDSLNILNEKAIGYARVSSKKQKDEGFSLPSQTKSIEIYVDEYNNNIDRLNTNIPKLNFIEIYEEIKPASTIEKNNMENTLIESLKNRPILQKIITMAQSKQFKHLIVFSRDRLTRNFEEFITLKFLLNKCGVEIHYSKTGENLSNKDKKIQRFLDNILANVAELEANTISIRVKGGSRLCVKKGYWAGGKAPLGYKLKQVYVNGTSKKNSILIPNHGDKDIVSEIFNCYENGYGYREIAKLLNEKYDTTIWSKNKIEWILKNKTYTGKIYWDRRGGRRSPGKHETTFCSDKLNPELCFIDESRWENIHKLRASKALHKDPKYYNTPFLLKNKLICPLCGEKLECKNYGKDSKGKDQRVYRCPTKLNKKSEFIIPSEYIEEMILNNIFNLFEFDNLDELWQLYFKQISKIKTEKIKIIAELKNDIKTVDILLDNLRNIIDIDYCNFSADFSDNENEHLLGDTSKKANQSNLKLSLLNKLEYQEALLKKTKKQFKNKINSINLELSQDYPTDKSKYIEALKSLKESQFNFLLKPNVDNRKKRLLLDVLIDNITMSPDGKEILSIILLPPKILI